MSQPWDIRGLGKSDDGPVTRFRHLACEYGTHDPANWEFDDSDGFNDEWNSDDSFSHVLAELYGIFEYNQSKYPKNPKDKVKRTPEGPKIALYDTSYFIPQWDEQMLGPEWRQRRSAWDFDNPPKPFSPANKKMEGAFKYCEHCQLTWLVGYSKVEGHQHPQHSAWGKEAEYIDISRDDLDTNASIVVHVHGDCLPEGHPSENPLGISAGIGIFFGKDSKYNMAAPHGNRHARPDAESAELAAIKLALTRATSEILEERSKFLKTFAKGKSRDSAKTDTGLAQPSSLGDSKGKDDSSKNANGNGSDDSFYGFEDLPFRIILVSDNARVINNICRHRKHWKERNGGLFTKDGMPVKNGDMYQSLEETISEIKDDLGLTLKWYCVPKEHNKDAARLAKEALQGNFSGFESAYKP